VTAFYHDEVSGGVDPVERERFSELLDILEEGDLVIAQKRDRLGRDVVCNAVTQRLINRKGAKLITLDCQECDTPEGALLSTLLDAMAQYEKALISARTRKALADRRRRGHTYNGNPELGTAAEGDRVVANQDEQAKIERVRAWRAEGLKFDQIQARCKAEGISSRSGMTPSVGTLSRWCRGVEVKAKRAARALDFVTKPRLEQRSEARGLAPLVSALRETGLSFDMIAGRANEEGYTTSRGKPLSKTQVIRIWKQNNLQAQVTR
jgi:DNA invertase Pin-like site-specific DNA recombinase